MCVIVGHGGGVFGAGLGWLYYYNYERVHSGYGMEGRTPYACCVALGFSGSEYVGLMPVVLSDNIVLDWSRQGVPAVNDVLTHYSSKAEGKNLPKSNYLAEGYRLRGWLLGILRCQLLIRRTI